MLISIMRCKFYFSFAELFSDIFKEQYLTNHEETDLLRSKISKACTELKIVAET